MVIKYGGAAMEDSELREEFARDVVLLKYVGLNPIVVHGGGPEITAYMKRLGLPVEFVGGLRVSDADTVEVAKMVLVGKVNKEIVLRLNRHGQPAVGLCGDDGSLFRVARRTAPGGEDIGFVGRIERVNAGVIEHVARDYIPVIASVGADRDGHSYNVNADEAAGAVAAALGAYKVIFLTDVPGWLADPADPASLIGQATSDQVRARAADAGRRHAPQARGVRAGDRRGRQRRAHPRRARRALAAAGAVHRRWHRHQDRGRIMSLAELQELERSSVIASYARQPVEFVRGEGARLWDDEGNEYLDFLCGISVTNIGHCHPRVVAAVREQVGRLMHTSNLFYTEPAMRLAQRLSQSSLGRQGVLLQLRRGGHRGGDQARAQGSCRAATWWSCTAPFTGAPTAPCRPRRKSQSRRRSRRWYPAFARWPPSPTRWPAPSTSARRPCCSSRSRGRAACTCCQTSMLAAARAACDEHGAALIFDEVQCGMGRTGTLWAYEQMGVRPDAMTVAKALGGGLPIGALITGERLADVLAPGDHGSTFAGGPVVAAAALAALEVTDEQPLLGRVRELGQRLVAGLRELPHVVSVRGRGMMLACELDVPAPEVVRRALLAQRLVVNATGPTTVRLLPPLTIEREQSRRGLARLAGALEG